MSGGPIRDTIAEASMRQAIRHWCEFEGLTFIQREVITERAMKIWQPGTARDTMIETVRLLIQEIR